MVIAAAGAVDHDAIIADVERRFATFNGPVGAGPRAGEVCRRHAGSRSATWSRPISRSRSKASRSAIPTLYSLQVFTSVVGGGMSSRLFQEVREKRGLCYAIYTFHWPYTDTGLFGLYAGTDADDSDELMKVVVDEITTAADTINEAEVNRAKTQMKAGLLMALESSGARAEQLARQIIAYGRPIPLEEIVAKVEAVTVESARAAGRALVGRSRPAVAALGPEQRARERRRDCGRLVAPRGVRTEHGRRRSKDEAQRVVCRPSSAICI